jgi:hypothetical protein
MNIIIINALPTIIFLGAFHNPLAPELYTINFTIKQRLCHVSRIKNLEAKEIKAYLETRLGPNHVMVKH